MVDCPNEGDGFACDLQEIVSEMTIVLLLLCFIAYQAAVGISLAHLLRVAQRYRDKAQRGYGK